MESWRATIRSGVARRTGGRWAIASLVGFIGASAAVGYLFAGDNQPAVAAVEVALLSGLAGAAIWVAFVVIWSVFRAPADMRRSATDHIGQLTDQLASEQRFLTAKAAFARAIEDGNSLREELLATVTDGADAWDARMSPWWTQAQEVVSEYAVHELPAFQATPSLRHVFIRGMPEWAGMRVQRLDDLIARLITIQRGLR